MRITAARCVPYRLRLREPVVNASARVVWREGALLELESDAGLRGWGDACPVAGFGLEAPGVAREAVARVAGLLRGRDIGRPEELPHEIAEKCVAAPTARAAAESALADLAARARGVGLADWLTARAQTESKPIHIVPVNALVIGAAPDEVARAARALSAQGYRAFKLKVGALEITRDLARVAALREAIGDGAELRLDANQAWSETSALEALEALARFRVAFVEQPVSARDLDGLARLRARSPIPIAADEAASDEASALRVIDAGAADWIILKPSALGGPSVAARVAERARAEGIGVIVTSLLDSAIGVASALHFAAHWGGVVGDLPACGLATGALLVNDLANLGPVVRGALPLPAGGGIGVEPDAERLATAPRGALEGERERWSSPWLALRAQRSPDATAIEWQGEAIDYAALHRRVRASAAALRRVGFRVGDVIATLLPNDLRHVELLHAAMAEGLVLLPLNTRLTKRELVTLLDDSGARALLHARALGDGLDEIAEGLPALRVIALAEDAPVVDSLSSESESDPPIDEAHSSGSVFDLDHPLAILYTSGTSGRPKGAVLSAGNFLASAKASTWLLGPDAQARWLLCMPLFHVAGLSVLLRAVLAGSTVILEPGFDPARVDRALDHDGVTGLSVVANMLSRILDARAGRPAPPRLRCVLLGGGPAADGLIARALELGFPIAPTYGLTEAASQVATRPPGVRTDAPASGLVPLPGTEVRIVGPEGAPLGAGAPGEIEVRGATVMQGYWRASGDAARANREGWLSTGDLGTLAPDGSLTIHDRRSDLIVSGGENVYPAEIETTLCDHDDVAEAAVAGRPDDVFGARPVAWVVPRAGAKFDGRALRRFCEERLARFKIPVRFHGVEMLPRNASGKLLRRALREPGE